MYWIVFEPDSTFEWIFKKYRIGLPGTAMPPGAYLPQANKSILAVSNTAESSPTSDWDLWSWESTSELLTFCKHFLHWLFAYYCPGSESCVKISSVQLVIWFPLISHVALHSIICTYHVAAPLHCNHLCLLLTAGHPPFAGRRQKNWFQALLWDRMAAS